MWRWLHSLPRAVRQQFHGPGASAGICVEELHENENICKEQKENKNLLWKSYCKQRGNQDDKGKSSKYHDFWRMVHGPFLPKNAIGWGGVVALGIQMGHFKCLSQKHRILEENKQHCLLYKIASALPDLYCVTPETQSSILSTVKKKHVDKNQESKILANTINQAPDVETLESAFENFHNLCQQYTATGKGIMASQAALEGDLEKAFMLWQESSTLGHSKSTFNLALCYEHGLGVKKDLAQAVNLYTKTADEGHLHAMFNLALLLMEGTVHTPRNEPWALNLLTKAADRGLVQAQRYLGVHYTEVGHDNPEMAVHYMTLAAEQQDAEALYYLGLFNEHGFGMSMNPCKAAHLYMKSSEKCHADATFSLAVFHHHGLGGLPENKDDALKLYQKAADLGHLEALVAVQNISDLVHAGNITDTSPQEEKVTSPVKFGSSVSTPCLTDLSRDNLMVAGGDFDLSCVPDSDTGTLSQLYTHLTAPWCWFDVIPSMTDIHEPSGSSATSHDSDSGVIFQLGLDDDDDIHVEPSSDSRSEINMATSSALARRYFSVPDMTSFCCV